ncbi:hormogonium tapered terminus morphoprotein TftA [Prochlorothrix hollandica]|uniref:Cell wall hydrolase n=1 Tax=Prochlorothrix hollandica PCC 9006 = CALU 1027 TaxID=317619 RepID=A0A0M2PX89_PROHO|nr:N-acetylmuramoyl-L-alanine amidase [Prochlorothrix hollandica]KKI99707.1 cell wall hydrolase [Prochlorothrix hollandica PCC 9006 = CALU 1027]
MGRIFISAGHGGLEDGRRDPGSIVGNTTEAQEMIQLRDLIVQELRSRNFEVLSVPDDLSAAQSIAWINLRYRAEDVALEIHADSFTNPSVRGASVFYIANNDERRAHGELMLIALLRRIPQLPNRGAKPDTNAGVGRLAFCRDTVAPSLLMEVGFLSSPDDRQLLQARRRDFALGLADGLAAWSRQVASTTVQPGEPSAYPEIAVRINGRNYPEKGILVNGNAYITIDLADSLGINAAAETRIGRLSYQGVVYMKAVDLREFNVSVAWDNDSRSVVLKTIFQICPGQLDRLMGHGNTSEVQLMMFLKSHNELALSQFPDIPKLYREEGALEGVNYDIAFCQMCLETNFLRFGGDVKSTQNNFAGLGATGAGAQGAGFASARLGVRAQIQHLKAYASTEPILQDIVDPRFRFVTRGVAPLVGLLSGRWAADLQYGDKIMAILRRLYESAGLI